MNHEPTVWAALNDPGILKQCIPGCQTLDMTSPTEMTAQVVIKIGPVKANFGGKVTLIDLDPPSGYKITSEGSGGVAGFQGRCRHSARGCQPQRDRTALRGGFADRRKAGAAWRPPDRLHRQEAGERVLLEVRRCSDRRTVIRFGSMPRAASCRDSQPLRKHPAQRTSPPPNYITTAGSPYHAQRRSRTRWPVPA